MAEDWIIIAHPDGRRFSVRRETLAELYGPQGFVEEGAETDAAFVADVPRPARRAGARSKTTKPARPASPPPAPGGEVG